MTNEYIIDVKNLEKNFEQRKVVKGISLQIKKSEIFGFLGPNGSGKTTTMRMLCGLLTPDGGSGSCLGYDLLKETKKIKQHVGYMTQRFSFYSDLSIEENLEFVCKIYEIDKKRMEFILEDFGLKERRKQLAGLLSGGWKQRLSLAACLLHKPKLLLLDEPTAGLDPIARREFWDRLHSLGEHGITTFVTTHYMDEAERCTRLAYLANGHLLRTGTVSQVINSTKLLTWQLFGDLPQSLQQRLKNLSSIEQVIILNEQIQICGYKKEQIEKDLQHLKKSFAIDWQLIPTNLENAFISLVKTTEEVGA